ncbi:hypothetical protein [Pseudomonas frederiksbergensis]|uniref:Uncharacterized protein n=1 Tax=Pseudomonas frederiksbergensis TaxID=104087 RepID=A0A6L5BL30_9PSED|nr:hypothetical protein [Pseudomonas frederiksbergensis]KAF2389289.1 hypothetical protein FX983_03728 [Pseudomonas frederiksbergensis]
MISLSRRLFLGAALWVPIVALVALMILDWVAGNSLTPDWKQFVMIHVLSFGVPAYIAFAAWQTRALSKVAEQQVLKKILCAPLTFIPFYAAPWVIGGLGLLLFGQLAGLGLMVMWVAMLPYLLVAGYVISVLTAALYWTFYS